MPSPRLDDRRSATIAPTAQRSFTPSRATPTRRSGDRRRRARVARWRRRPRVVRLPSVATLGVAERVGRGLNLTRPREIRLCYQRRIDPGLVHAMNAVDARRLLKSSAPRSGRDPHAASKTCQALGVAGQLACNGVVYTLQVPVGGDSCGRSVPLRVAEEGVRGLFRVGLRTSRRANELVSRGFVKRRSNLLALVAASSLVLSSALLGADTASASDIALSDAVSTLTEVAPEVLAGDTADTTVSIPPTDQGGSALNRAGEKASTAWGLRQRGERSWVTMSALSRLRQPLTSTTG